MKHKPTLLLLALLLALPACYEAGWADLDTDGNLPPATDGDTDMDSDSDSDSAPDRDSDTSPPLQSCLYMDGDGDHMRVPHDDILNLTEDWTLEAWFVYNAGHENLLPIIRKGDEIINIASYFLYAEYTGYAPMGGYGISTSYYSGAQPSESAPAEQWVHLAVTVDKGEQIRLYQDGILVAQTDDPPEQIHVDNDLIIGSLLRPTLLSYFDGCVDEIRISRSARYQDNFVPESRPSVDEDTIALWHFDELGDSEAIDSANGLVGTLEGDAEIIEY